MVKENNIYMDFSCFIAVVRKFDKILSVHKTNVSDKFLFNFWGKTLAGWTLQKRKLEILLRTFTLSLNLYFRTDFVTVLNLSWLSWLNDIGISRESATNFLQEPWSLVRGQNCKICPCMNFYQPDMWWLNSAGPQKRRRRRSGVTFSWFWTQSPSNGQRGCRKCWSSLRRKRTHQMIKRTRPFIAGASMLFVSSSEANTIVCFPDIFQQRGIPK